MEKRQNYVKGAFTHRRTEADYMGTLLDAVTLEDWREIVGTAVTAAKAGDPGARAWLAQYLVGKPNVAAPAPLTVVFQQLAGCDPLIEKLAKPHLDRAAYPSLHVNDDFKDDVKAQVANELRALELQQKAIAKNCENVTETKRLA
jgi:hypothetical protein